MVLRRITAKAVIHRAPTGVDENGYPLNTGAWDEWERVEWPVYSVGPREYEEEFAKGRRTVTSRLRVSCPLGGPRPAPDDMVTIPGLEDGGPFSVDGEPQVWEKNPITTITRYAGVVVYLERRRR